MPRDYWADYFRKIFIPETDAFAGCLPARVLPAFDNIDEEASRVEEEEYRRLCGSFDPETGPDEASLAEWAQDHAVSHYMTLHEVRQGVVNLFGVGLWHRFEQQLATYARRALPYEFQPPNPPSKDVEGALMEMGINLALLPSYPKIEELRLLANCAKHGDGPSCAQLAVKRPDLFRTPWQNAEGHFPSLVPLRVIAPLGGEDLYLTPEAFKEYAEAVKTFWEEFAAELERQAHG
jgi:hypothetical protein